MAENNFQLPEHSLLAELDPLEQAHSQPDWIKENHPDYIESHGSHHDPLTSVRKFTHQGHEVKITTTYRIEIDGVDIQPHALVDNEGNLFSHVMPFETYGSAPELIKTLLDRFPEFFAKLKADAEDNHSGHHPHHDDNAGGNGDHHDR